MSMKQVYFDSRPAKDIAGMTNKNGEVGKESINSMIAISRGWLAKLASIYHILF